MNMMRDSVIKTDAGSLTFTAVVKQTEAIIK